MKDETLVTFLNALHIFVKSQDNQKKKDDEDEEEEEINENEGIYGLLKLGIIKMVQLFAAFFFVPFLT